MVLFYGLYYLKLKIKTYLQALGVFGLCQIHAFIDYVRSKVSKEYFEILFKALVSTILAVAIIIGIILTITGN